jgi:hypothetical protein
MGTDPTPEPERDGALERTASTLVVGVVVGTVLVIAAVGLLLLALAVFAGSLGGSSTP